MSTRRVPIVLAAALLATAVAAAQEPSPAPPTVAAGIRQVQEGDFEGAVATLEAAARDLADHPEKKRELVQAYVYLGVAQVALDQTEQARRSFTQALAADPKLKLSPQAFAPKVVAAFEQARRTAAPRRSGGGRVGWILGGAAAGAAAAVIATSGGEQALFANARMAIPVIECPNGAEDMPIGFAVLVDARNPGGAPLSVQSVTAAAIIVASPAIPEEVGQASSRPTTATPSTVPAGTNTTVRVDSTLPCSNGFGGPPRFNEWSVRVTLTTSAGVFVLDAADRLRVNNP